MLLLIAWIMKGLRMLNTREDSTVKGVLPGLYQEVLYWRVTDSTSRLLAAQALAVAGFLIFGWVFISLAITLGAMPASGTFVLELGPMILLLIGVVLTLIAHEGVHGLAMSFSGAKPRYGILWKGLMLYATAPGFAFTRNAYVFVLLAPFVLISALVVLGLWLFPGSQWTVTWVACGVLNASGAVGDLWMTLIALRYPATARIMDEHDGMRVFLPQTEPTDHQAARAPDPFNLPDIQLLSQKASK